MSSIILKDINLFIPLQSHMVTLKRNLIDFTGRFLKKFGNDGASSKGSFKALESINLEIHEGDRLGIIGPNGAGKTTLLRLIAGIYHPTEGICSVQGNISALIDISYGMHPELTGYENAYAQLLLNKVSESKIKEIIPEIFEFSGLNEFIHLPLKTYSAGMSMRLCFSVATATRSSILLMDEWLSTGDLNFLNKAQMRISQLVDESKIVVFGSHDLDLIKKTCNKAIYLKGGKIEFLGTPDEAIDIYKNDRK